MKKIRREIIRGQVKLALGFPWLLPESVRSGIFRRWNRCQRDFTADAYAKDDPAPRPEPPLRLLDLSCTSGFGENVHPDVLYVPEGFGAGGWRYFMACTPLPQGVEYFENPEFLVSMDGLRWHVPNGGASPLVGAPDDWIGYNSDPALYLEDGELSLFYRDYRAYSGYSIIRILVKKPATLFPGAPPRPYSRIKGRSRKQRSLCRPPSSDQANSIICGMSGGIQMGAIASTVWRLLIFRTGTIQSW